MSKIKDIPYIDRPYEKLIMYGEKELTDVELLSIIIKSGTKRLSAIDVAQNLVKSVEDDFLNFRFLQNISIEELTKIDGIGIKKAIELKAIGEIAKRISKPLNKNKIKIQCSKDIADIFMCELQNEKNEILKIVILNNLNIIKKVITIAVGNENNIMTSIKTILSEPVKVQAPKIILIHNHPSGNPTPSKVDIHFTQKVKDAANILDIELLDHIIIGDGVFKSII